LRQCVARGAWAALASLALARTAAAAAWTLAPGAGFVSASASYFSTGGDEAFEEVTTSTYGEYGAAEGFTIGGVIESSKPVGAVSDQSTDVTLAAFGRLRLHSGAAGDPFSLQAGVVVPLDTLSRTGAQQLDSEQEVDLRALYGRGFATGWGDAFYDLQGGVRIKLRDGADEVKLDLTAGLRPAPGWLLLIQSFSTIGMRNNGEGGSDFDVFRLAPSVGYELWTDVTLLLGIEQDVAGRSIDKGTRLKLAVWTTF